MKKIVYIVSLFLTIVLYTSCDALDLSPEDYYGSGNFWDNKAQVDGYMLGMHAQLRSDYYNMFYCLGELRGGTQRVGTSSENTSLDYAIPRTNTLSEDNPGFSNWFGLYSPIMQVNHFIQKVKGECTFLNDNDRKLYLGQAYGLRAMYYFILFKTYGGVPIVTEVELLNGKVTAEKFYIPRNTPEETMAFIKEDIGKSETNLGDIAVTDKYIWSKAATLMLKAEIYMWAAKVSITDFQAKGKSDLEIAKTALNGVIGNYSLLGNFADVFDAKNKKSKEIIFAMPFVENEAGNWGGAFLYQDAVFIDQVYGRDGNKISKDTLNLKGTGGVFRHEYTEAFWKSYKAADTRRDATFLEYYQKKNAETGELNSFGCVMKKGLGTISSTNNRIYISDIPVYRYSDALLMMAEIENGLGNSCASYINEVRKRAYGSAYEANKYVEGSYAANELAILQERDKEFVWEGKRWFDLVRMHDAEGKSLAFSATANYPAESSIINSSESFKLLWPINVGTLTSNPLLKQTPGYKSSVTD